MKRQLLILHLFLCLGLLNAQESFHFRTDVPQGLSVKSSSSTGLSLHYSIQELRLANIDNGEAKGQEIILKGQFAPNAEGLPNLPVVNRYVAIPRGATVDIKFKENASTVLHDVDLLPAAPVQTNIAVGLPQLRWDNQIYSKNADFPVENIVLSTPTQIRSLDVVLLSITPFRYNPVRRTLEVIYDIDIDLRFEGGNGQFGESRYFNPDWEHLLRSLVINGEMLSTTDYYDLIKSARNRDEEGCEYLIIAPDDATALAWADTLKAFRTKQGILTKVVRLSECGVNNATSVRNYILNAYNTWAIPPAAVLLFSGYNNAVGIHPYYHRTVEGDYSSQIYPTDYPYSDMNGDSLADIALSRVTAITPEEYQAFVEKTIEYESNPPTDDAYYDHPIITSGHEDNKWFMISSQSINGFYRDKIGKHPVNHYMMVNSGTLPDTTWSTGYNASVLMDYFGPHGQNYIPQHLNDLPDWRNKNDNTALLSALSEGSFLTLYRDHSNFDNWWCPNFDNDDVNSLVDEPSTFVLSISCSTAAFDEYSKCLIDAFCMKPKGGAIGGIGSTSLTHSYFNDILTWGFFDYIWPSFLPDMGNDTPPDFIRPSYVLAAAKHCFAYHVFLPNWWIDREQSTMHLFCYTGETYLNLYTETPQPLQITNGLFHPTGSNAYTVTAEEGALVCLSKNGEIIEVTLSDGQAHTFTLPHMEAGEHFTLTATKQNRFRYEQEIAIIPDSGPYVTIEQNGVFIENDYDILHNGESAHLGLRLHNYGNNMAGNTSLYLTCGSPFIEITQGTCQYQDLGPNQAVTINNAFHFNIANDIPDMTQVLFTIHLDDGNGEKTQDFVQHIAAPLLVIQPELSFRNTNRQPILQINKEGYTDIHVIIANEGHFDSDPIHLQFELMAPFLSIDAPSRMINSLEKGTTNDMTFRVNAHNSTIDEGWIKTKITLDDGVHRTTLDTFLPFGGYNDTYESGNLNLLNWLMGGDASWELTTDESHSGNYCIRSGIIQDDQSSSVSITRTTQATSISFFKKVSSEANYDKLHFSIDGMDLNEWSGTIPWSKERYAVTPGTHTFTWSYIKDSSMTGGSDCAWIDDFSIEPTFTPIASSGDTLNACHDEEVPIECNYAYHYSNLEWSTTGDGHFDNPHALHPVYSPGPQDQANGGTTLHLSVDGETSSLILVLTDEINIGDAILGDNLINPETTVFSHYFVEKQAGVNYVWSLEPEEAGHLFVHDNEVDIVWDYQHNITDATLTVSADAHCSQSLSKPIQFDVLTVKEDLSPTFTLYPNPTDGMVHLILGQTQQGKSVVEIYDVLGTCMTHKVFPNTTKGQTIEINLSNYAPGIYIVKLRNDEGCWSQKISVK